jgi:hypothetical protein
VEGGQGLWAFVIGLSVTGWAETARVVRELTRGVRGQAYVEAARALGASDAYLLRRHALPHVLPMAWVLLAFEVSGTILTVAGLGFLGYFTNDVWAMISDTVAQRYAGLPDLGQMLSTVSSDIFTGPYKMFMAGSMVFITVLGFNLLGAGLRQQLNVERVRRRTQVTVAREWVRDVIEDRIRPGLDSRAGQWAQNAIVIAAALVVLGYGAQYWRSRAAGGGEAAVLAVPGGHLWGGEHHDPYGTRAVAYAGPTGEAQLAWSFVAPMALVGGPAVAADGTLYIASLEPMLYALDDQGAVQWQATLDEEPVGSPALGLNGEIYVVGKAAGLVAFSPDGQPVWHLAASAPGEATGGPTVAPDGTIYFTVAGQIQAVSAEGQALWRGNAYTRRVSAAPSLTASGAYVYLRGLGLAAADGQPLADDLGRKPDQLVTGADGRDYLRIEHILSPWTEASGQLHLGEPLTWEYGNYAFGTPTEGGVLADGTYWVAYLPDFQDARFVYVRSTGAVAGFTRFAYAPAAVIGLDADQRAYVCGSTLPQAQCLALQPGLEEPLWTVDLQGYTVTGGALAPGRLYVAVAEGGLFAITGSE